MLSIVYYVTLSWLSRDVTKTLCLVTKILCVRTVIRVTINFKLLRFFQFDSFKKFQMIFNSYVSLWPEQCQKNIVTMTVKIVKNETLCRKTGKEPDILVVKYL